MHWVGRNSISHHGEVRRAKLDAGWNQKPRVMDYSSSIHIERRMIERAAIENVAGGAVAKPDDRIVCRHRRVVPISNRLGEAINLTSIQRICAAAEQGRWNACDVGLPHRIRSTCGSVDLDVR